MSDFSVYILAATFPCSVNYPPWIDPPTTNDPTRLNVRADVQHRYAQVLMNGASLVTVEIHARLPSEDDPPDADLGGRLFSWSVSMFPVGAPNPGIVTPSPGNSYLAQITISALYPGHYRVNCARPGSGTVCLPFDVELP